MAVIVNWIELQDEAESYIEIPLLDATLVVYFFDNVIVKTEWKFRQSPAQIMADSPWKQLQAYLRNPVLDLTVYLKKQGSMFRHKVWSEMCRIPAGQTRTYSQLAGNIGSGARAVANACRDNPFPGIIPCHRVVAVSGLGGYMGQVDGQCLEIKRQLLALESKCQKEAG